MKKILILLSIGFVVYFCFRLIGDKFIYGWVAGILATLFSNLTNKKR